MTSDPGDERDNLEFWDEYGDEPLYDDADSVLVELVADLLVTDIRVRGRDMRVAVQNRVVILEGTVESEAVKEAAGARAWPAPGVYDVCNMLVPDAT